MDALKKATAVGTTCSHANGTASSAAVIDKSPLKSPLSVRQRNCFSKKRTAVVPPIRFEAEVTAASGSAPRKSKDIPKKRAATAVRSVLLTDKSSQLCRKRKKADVDLVVNSAAALQRRRRYDVVKVVGGRTFSDKLARKIIAGYMNPRIYPEISHDPMNRRDYWCSRNSVLAKYIPRHLSEALVESLTRHQANFNGRDHVSHPCVLPSAVIPHGAKIGRTFVANIHLAFVDLFGNNNVSLERPDCMNSGRHFKHCSVEASHILEIVVMDVVLARSKKTAPVLTSTNATVDSPVKMKIENESLKGEKHDACFRAFLALLPEAGVYYCHRERRKEYVGVANAHVPMDIDWLRIVKNGSRDNRFSPSGYVTRLWDGKPECIWKWKVSR